MYFIYQHRLLLLLHRFLTLKRLPLSEELFFDVTVLVTNVVVAVVIIVAAVVVVTAADAILFHWCCCCCYYSSCCCCCKCYWLFLLLLLFLFSLFLMFLLLLLLLLMLQFFVGVAIVDGVGCAILAVLDLRHSHFKSPYESFFFHTFPFEAMQKTS